VIDPRTAPVAMLPYLNAIAGFQIAAAAPLRRINVEDTEQMICEAADLSADPDEVEAELARAHSFTMVDFETFARNTVKHWEEFHRTEKFGPLVRDFIEVMSCCVRGAV
jgi:hypothetical protein